MNDELIAIALVFIILAVIFILYYFYIYNSDESRRERYRELYSLSNGGYDANAENALNLINEVDHPTAEDTFTAGNIIGLNVLQGRLGGNRENRETAEQVINHMRDTIGNIAGGNVVGIIAREFMVDQVEAFAENNLRDLLLEADFNFWRPVVVGLGVTLGEVPAVRENILDQRKKRAAKEAKNRLEYAEELLDSAKTHTSDSQNVHDSSVVKDLSHTLTKLKQTALPGNVNQALTEVENYVKENITGDKKHNVLRVLEETRKNTFLSSYNASEGEILKYVWDRTKLPENSDNSENMKEALIDELANCVQGSHGTVCVGGRASRMLGSLVLQDVDEELGAASTLEQYKNEIFDECHKMIDSEVKLAQSEKNEHYNAARSYSDPKVSATETEENEFKQHLKNNIDDILTKYKDKLGENQLSNLKKDCYAAVE